MLTFLVERYWPGVTEDEVASALARAALLVEEMRRQGKPVRYLHGTYVPGDETVFSVVEARSAHDVAELTRRAGLSFDRIAEAVPLRVDLT